MPEKLIYDIVETEGKQNKAVVVIHGWKGNKNSFKTVFGLISIKLQLLI